MSDSRIKLVAAAVKKKRRLELNQCYDPLKPKSRPTIKQAEILKDQTHRILYVVAGNQSGKSVLGGRLTSWYFQESHPYWERPNNKECHHCKSTNFELIELEDGGETEEFRCNDCSAVWCDWGTEPLTLIVSGKVSKMVKELWEKKIEPFLEPSEYKLEKDGTALSSVRNLKNGNKIIFLSHDKAIVSKEKIQSYVAHFVWIDEMPDHYSYLEEAIQRVTSKLGRIVCTFTPKTSNPQIKDMVEGCDETVAKKYQFGKLDNPINQSPEKRAIVLAELAGQSKAIRNCVLHGDWLDADDSVFSLNRDEAVLPLPEAYSKKWEHIASYDPAASGKGGLIVATRPPRTNKWIVVRAEYIIGGKAPSDNIEEIDRILDEYNITRKIYDTHEAWFILEWNKMRREGKLRDSRPWTGVEKSGRKKDLITNLQQRMLDLTILFTPELFDLFNEFTSAQWADGRDDKIQGSQHYHLLDALQYLVDLLPAKKPEEEFLGRDAQLIRAAERAAFAQKKNDNIRRRVSKRGRRRR